MIAVLAGGVGAARFLEGLVQVVPPEMIVAIVNTGDDMVFHGLHVSPDIDIVTYTLAGIVDPLQGWGIRDDTTHALSMLATLGAETWFKLGDRDLAVHIRRTELLRAGWTLSQVTDAFRRALNVGIRLLPMSDDPVVTEICTPVGWLHFQQYLVQRRARDEALGVRFTGIERARPAPGVLEALCTAEVIMIAPSNPVVSIGTILAVPGVRDAIIASPAPVVAVSPIIAGAPVKGPAAPLMRAVGLEVSARGVAACYRGLIDVLVIDQADADLADDIRASGVEVAVADTVMRGPVEKRRLAEATLVAARTAVRRRSY
ncbi:MAG: 2-phospho-L-lactate transferase [Roseiflexus sp.]|nr:2-phospho-L-lactate transferase [Roseiflexus sp.]MCS7291139.1 2-phospho-L-lactate transferase [Roseiflexus sp.]MDW8147767.1 2-phospho-L-lactate transferase [Roseiflexaceae bacterium]MDW8232454.1 2-phospho-L-lactate transferase [Roseiflexaceae bacterium]